MVGRDRNKRCGNEAGRDEVILDVERRRLLHDLEAQVRDPAIPVKERRQAVVRLAFDGVHQREGECGARPAMILGLRPDAAGLHDDVPVASPPAFGPVSDDVLGERDEITLVGEEGQGDAREQLRIPPEDGSRRQCLRRGDHFGLGQPQRPEERRMRLGSAGSGNECRIRGDSTRPGVRQELGRANALSVRV